MFIVHGHKTALIKKYNYQRQPCKSCGSFNWEVKVYRNYYHVYYIPLMPYGPKNASINCADCHYPNNWDEIRKEYEKETKTPLYLYAIPLLFTVIVAVVLFFNLQAQKQKKLMVANPQVGDVYLVRTDLNNTTTYYFLRLATIKGDTVLAYHNNLVYYGFTTSFDPADFFVTTDQLLFTKSGLKQMLEKDEINAVERGYASSDGFNRLK